jgi:SAM-dependent methyltransferase
MKYLKYRLRTKWLHLFGQSSAAECAGDDFDWRAYSTHYAEELKEVEKDHTTRLSPQDYRFADGRLTQQSSILPLHPNHRLLYETLLQLQPASVLELGCGGGDHLYNLSILAPQIQVAGVDRSIEQLTLLERRSPGLRAVVSQADITCPLPASLSPVDIAYTQAVIMHIQTGEHHLTALANLFEIATKQVVMIENWERHPFLEDIRRLHAQGRIPWKSLHFYFRRAPEFGDKPHLMVISAVPLDYEPLEDYNALFSRQ